MWCVLRCVIMLRLSLIHIFIGQDIIIQKFFYLIQFIRQRILMTIKCICGMDDTTVMIKVDFQDMQIIGMMHSVIVKNRAKCGVQEIRCQRLIVDIGQKFVYTKLIVLKEVLRESSFGELIGGKCGLVRARCV